MNAFGSNSLRSIRVNAVNVVTTALILCALPTIAFAAGGGGDGDSLKPFLWSIFNFALLVVGLVYVARKAVVAFFAERRDTINNDIEQASGLLRDAELQYGEWQRKLVDLESDLESIRETARTRSEAERDHIIAEAQATAERIKRDAKAAIEQEIRRAKGELAQEASTLSLELATSMLRDQVSDSDRDRLIDEFISSVERQPQGSGASSDGER
jgi:F-type H+-transporting ATPase subunit b